MQSLLASPGLKQALDRIAGGMRRVAQLTTPGVRWALFEQAGRLRLWSYLAWGALLGAAAFAVALGLGGAALFGADPFRLLSRPLQVLQGADSAAETDPQARARRLYGAESALLALLAQASASPASPNTTAPLREGVRALRALAQSAAEAPPGEVDEISRQAALAFGAALAQELLALIEADAARAEALAAAGWEENLAPAVRALRQARQPLQRLSTELAGAADAASALGAAGRIAEVGAAMAGVRAPIVAGEQVLALRRAFSEVEARIGALLAGLREDAENRPWLLAPSERKQAWRLANARWQAATPLAGRLAAARLQAFAAGDPDGVRGAIHAARQIETELGVAVAQTPAPEAQAEPSPPPRADYRDRAMAAAREARDVYRAAYEAYAPVITAPYVRRRDRRRAADMRDELAALYELSRDVIAIEQRLLAGESEGQAERLARRLPGLAEDMQDRRRRLDRLASAFR